MSHQTKKQQERKKFWVRVICIALAFLMVSSLLLALLQ